MNRVDTWQQKKRLKLTDSYCYTFLSLSLSFPGLAVPFCGGDEGWPSAPSCNSSPIWWRTFFTPVSIVYFSDSQTCFPPCVYHSLQNVFALLPFSLKPQICFQHKKAEILTFVWTKPLLCGWKAARSCGESVCLMGCRSDSAPKRVYRHPVKLTDQNPSIAFTEKVIILCSHKAPPRRGAQNERQSVTRVSREASVLCVISCKHTPSRESLYWRAGTPWVCQYQPVSGECGKRASEHSFFYIV